MSQSLNPVRLNRAPATARNRLGDGLLVAVLLHLFIVAAILFHWPHAIVLPGDDTPVVPVDLVTIADQTNIAPTVDRTPKPPADLVKPPPTDTPVQVLAPTPPAATAEAEPAPELAPKPLQKPQPAPVPKPDTKPPPPDEKKKPKADSIDDIIGHLTTPATAPRNARTADRTVQGVGAMNASTMDLVDALRNAIAQCWNPPVGAPHPERLIVTFELQLAPDGSVYQAVSSDTASGDPYMRAAAEAARRAIYTCQPYKLPPAKYNMWRDITIAFDPRKMLQP